MSKVVHLGRYAAVVKWTGAEIKARRVAKGWTQQQLADAIAAVRGQPCRRKNVINWETGAATPQDRWFGAFEQVLGDVEPDAQRPTDPPLSQATFPQVLNRLVDLHNDVARASLDRVLRVEDAPLPPDFEHDHDIVEGPYITEHPDHDDDADTASQSRQRPNE